MDRPEEPLRPISRRVLHRGAKFDFEQITFAGSDGRPLTREVVRHPGAVVVVPVLEEGGRRSVVFVRNERLAAGKWLLELPAGTMEPPEAPGACAARELIEETGYKAATLTPLARFYTTPGMTDELMHAFVATRLRHVGQKLELDERLRVEVIGAERAVEMAARGELEDAKTMLSLMLAERAGVL